MDTLDISVSPQQWRTVFGVDEALKGHSIVCEQCCAPPMLCLLWTTVRHCPRPPPPTSSRTTPHEDNSPPDKNKTQPLPTRTTIPRTISHQDNSPLGPLPWNKTTHQDQNLYGRELPTCMDLGSCPDNPPPQGPHRLDSVKVFLILLSNIELILLTWDKCW